MKYMNLTWPQMAELDKSGLAAVLPLGAVEQHGKHLPLGVDAYLVQGLADALDERLADKVVMLPPVWIGHSPHHLHFAGSLSVSHDTYAELLAQMISSLFHAGFTKIVLMNGHGGNGLPIQMALQSVKNKYRDRSDLFVCGFSYWHVARSEMQAVRESAPGGMGHACEMETSMMLHLHGDLVRMEHAAKDGRQPNPKWIPFDMLGGAPLSAVYDFHELTESGTFGDPTLATADKGARFFAGTVERVAELLRDVADGAFV